MKQQEEKTNAMMREFQHVKTNVEKVVEICESANPSTHTIPNTQAAAPVLLLQPLQSVRG